MIKKMTGLFSASLVLAMGIVGVASLTTKQQTAVNAEVVEILPWAKYEFKDSTNPGKDTMNKHNLTLAGTGVTVSNGVVSFDGNGALVSSSPEIGDDLDTSAYSLVFDIEYTGGTTSHNMQPIGFGWVDYESGFYDRFLIPQGWNALCYGNSGDGVGTQAWQLSTIRQEMPSSGFLRIIQTLKPGGNAVVYAPKEGTVNPGESPINAVYTKSIPSTYSVKHTNTSFSIGDDAAWNNFAKREPFVGSIKNVAIYDFAMTADQAVEYYNTGKLEHDVTATVTDATVDLSSTIIANEGDSDEVILLTAPKKSTITVTMSDESTQQATATWQSVTTIGEDKYLVGELSGVVNTDNVKAYGKVGFTSSSIEIAPVAKYEFLDSSNPGKDSMGNYNLEVTAAPDVTPTITCADGAVTFAGDGGLVASKNINDISEDLAAMTLVYDVKIAANPSGWQEPCGFGWDNWSATWWNVFMIGENSSMLRFTAKNIDTNANQYWGYEIGNISTESYSRVILKINPGEYASVWLNGVKAYDWACPSSYNMKNSDARFALGGNGTWGNVSRDYFRGSLKNVAIYDFAMTDQQAAVYNATGKVKSNLVSEYLTVDPTPIFSGAVTSGTLDDSMDTSTMLSKVNAAQVKGTIGATEKLFDVKWEKVENRSGAYYVVGSYKVVGQSVPTASSRGVVEKQLEVVINKDVVQNFVDTYMHMTDYTENLGWCKDSEHHYYADAKAAYNELTEAQKVIFNTDSTFSAAAARFYAWAAANGETVNTTTYAIESYRSNSLFANFSDSSTFIIVCAAFAAISLAAFTLTKISKKRKNY